MLFTAASKTRSLVGTRCVWGVTLVGLPLVFWTHTYWPDGIAGTAGGVVDHEPAMLDFLRQHPLP